MINKSGNLNLYYLSCVYTQVWFRAIWVAKAVFRIVNSKR
jgi:hypothetical protein